MELNQSQIAMVSAGFIIIMNVWLAANVGLFALLYAGISRHSITFSATYFYPMQGPNSPSPVWYSAF